MVCECVLAAALGGVCRGRYVYREGECVRTDGWAALQVCRRQVIKKKKIRAAGANTLCGCACRQSVIIVSK